MCDYSLVDVASRPAKVGEKLITTNFGTGSRGFAGVDDPKTAVCLMPGTELAFDVPVKRYGDNSMVEHKTAIFRQVHKDQPHMHHDAMEFPDGSWVLLTFLAEGQKATVLQLPAVPRTAEEAKEQERLPMTERRQPATLYG